MTRKTSKILPALINMLISDNNNYYLTDAI